MMVEPEGGSGFNDENRKGVRALKPSDCEGSRVALLFWYQTAGKQEVSAWLGVASWREGILTLCDPNDEFVFEVPEEWLDRLEPLDDELGEELGGAGYAISLSVGDVTEHSGTSPPTQLPFRIPNQ